MAAVASSKQTTASVKSARKDLENRVRDDWAFNRQTASNPLRSNPITYSIADERVVAWREPYYASSDPSHSSDDEQRPPRRPTSPGAKSSPRRPQKPGSTSVADRLKRSSRRFFGGKGGKPEDAATESESDVPPIPTVAAKDGAKDEHKDRQRIRFQDEAGWNGGVDHFERQREAWTCARDAAPPAAKATSNSSESSNDDKSEKGSQRSSESSAPSPTETSKPRATKPQFPVAAPILPDTDPARAAAVSEGAHESIYEKDEEEEEEDAEPPSPRTERARVNNAPEGVAVPRPGARARPAIRSTASSNGAASRPPSWANCRPFYEPPPNAKNASSKISTNPNAETTPRGGRRRSNTDESNASRTRDPSTGRTMLSLVPETSKISPEALATEAPPVPPVPEDAAAAKAAEAYPVVGSRRPRPVISRPSSQRPGSNVIRAPEGRGSMRFDGPDSEGLLWRTSRHSSVSKSSLSGLDEESNRESFVVSVGGPRRTSAVTRIRDRISSGVDFDLSGLQEGGPQLMNSM